MRGSDEADTRPDEVRTGPRPGAAAVLAAQQVRTGQQARTDQQVRTVQPAPTAHLPQSVAGVLRRGAGAGERRARLRALVASRRAFLVPGITDAMGALLVAQAGFPAAYVTGAGFANAVHGVPDVGLLGLGDLAPHVARLAATADTPLIVDADNGFGGPLSVARTVQELERAGAAAVQIEDQEMPRRCGHFEGHTVIPAPEMQSKITAAVRTREDPDLVVIARTDARSAVGLDEALRRAHAYADAGADMVFVEAPRTVAELERIGRELCGVPLVVNVVEGGRTPQLSFADYQDLGFSLVLYANVLLRAMMRTGADLLRRLADEGDSRDLTGSLSTWEERQSLFGLPEFTETETWFDRP